MTEPLEVPQDQRTAPVLQALSAPKNSKIADLPDRELIGSDLADIFVVNYDSSTTGYMGNVVWAFLDFESDKQQEYSYTHSTWAGGQSTYPGFSWVVKNNKRDAVDIDTNDTFAQSMTGYSTQSNQQAGVQFFGRTDFNTWGTYSRSPYFTDNAKGICTLPLYPQTLFKVTLTL